MNCVCSSFNSIGFCLSNVPSSLHFIDRVINLIVIHANHYKSILNHKIYELNKTNKVQ